MSHPIINLIFFIDETGDETLLDDGNPVFALGGCGLLVQDVDMNLRTPWANVRGILVGDKKKPVHASKIEKRFTPKKENAVIDFFLRGNFFRAASVLTRKTCFDSQTDDFDPIITSELIGLIHGILSLSVSQPFHRLTCVFEKSCRLEPKLKKAIEHVKHDGGGQLIPVEWLFVPKSEGEIGLEVADFMMHSLAGHFRYRGNPANKFLARFQAMFPEDKPHLSHFSETLSIETR